MKIGLTYDLRTEHLSDGWQPEDAAEFDSEETIDALADVCLRMGHDVDKIGHVKRLASRLVSGERWDLVFNIAEGCYGTAREAQVPSLLDAYQIPYTFSGPLTLALCLHKGMAKRIVRDHGLRTPPFAVVSTIDELCEVALAFPLFVKPVAEGSSKGIGVKSIIRTRQHLDAVCEQLLGRFKQPVLIEEYLPGREFTVGILGQGRHASVMGVMEIVLRPNADYGVYSYQNKEHYEDRVEYRLADDEQAWDVARLALAAWAALGCRDAGRVDIRMDQQSRPSFIECNPLPGLQPHRSDLVIMARLCGWDYTRLISTIVMLAKERLGK